MLNEIGKNKKKIVLDSMLYNKKTKKLHKIIKKTTRGWRMNLFHSFFIDFFSILDYNM